MALRSVARRGQSEAQQASRLVRVLTPNPGRDKGTAIAVRFRHSSREPFETSDLVDENRKVKRV